MAAPEAVRMKTCGAVSDKTFLKMTASSFGSNHVASSITYLFLQLWFKILVTHIIASGFRNRGNLGDAVGMSCYQSTVVCVVRITPVTLYNTNNKNDNKA